MFILPKHIRLFFVISFLGLISTACQVTEPAIVVTETAVPDVAAATTSPTAVPTETAIPVAETATEIPPTITPTSTTIPAVETATRYFPTATSAALSSSTAVPPTPTPIPTETEPTVEILQEQESLSPDGQWRAHTLLTFVEEDGQVVGYQTDLTVSMLEGDISWLAYSTLQGTGMGYDVPTVVLWSEDGRSLFFTLRATPDGCSTFVGQFDSGLYQLDLANGEVEQHDVSGALSPDGTTVAHLVWEPVPAVALVDLDSQTTTTIAWEVALERGNSALNLVWSPDSQAIALEHSSTFCFEGDYSLIHLDLATAEQTTLIWQEPHSFFIAEWPNVNDIYLQDRSQEGQKWSLNVSTGERTRID